MKQTKLISLLLVLCMVAALLVPGTVAMEAKAADGDDTEGLVVNKTATAKDDGTYTITLEAYATGESVTSSTKKDVPTDIILVLDQSGSMIENNMSTYSFSAYRNESNEDYYNLRHDGGSANLYYKLEDAYVSVSVEREQKLTYTLYEGQTNYTYYQNQNNLYTLVDGEYKKVTVDSDWDYNSDWEWNYIYTYKVDGTQIAYSKGYNNKPDFGEYEIYLHQVDGEQSVYIYTYTDSDGINKIVTSTGASSAPSETFYRRSSSGDGPTRLEALKTAVGTFANSVRQKSLGEDSLSGTDDDVHHRIAVVGFATGSYSGNEDYPAYQNTELFIGGEQYNYAGGAINSQYGRAFQDMNTEVGYNNVIASKNALAGRGATCVDLGMEMAMNIFKQNPIPQGEKRNRIVIVFSDGEPSRWSSFDSSVANDAINFSKQIQNNYGAEVYSIGVFDGANATSPGNAHGNTAERANWFMQNVSSNNGTPNNPSFYLSAADAGTLNSIFEQIASSIESGGSSIKLGAEAVIQDEISPYFALPEGTAESIISVQTVPYENENQWGDGATAVGVDVDIKDNKVSVTGFDFSKNWCGPRTVDGTKTYAGNKLVISFNVEPKDGFLGGNNVPTNANAGVYENSDKTEPLKKFPVPEVNVPIQNINVTAKDKNVYLLGDLTKEQLTSGATVNAVENIEINLDPTAKNYGLESWQNAFVEIKTSLSDSDGNPLDNGFKDLKDDTSYQLTVTVSPKEVAEETSNGDPATEVTGKNTAKVNVFKPEITWKDSQLNSGETPDYEKENFVKADWKHDGLTYTKDNMTGEEPTLTYTYDPVENALTEETPVKVTVKIDDQDVTANSVFVHDKCTFDNCKWETEYEGKGYRFVVHLNTFDLTIKKSDCNETLDPNQSFVFRVTGPNNFDMEVVIKGNGSTTIKNLPAGEYTVTEDINWSWRYRPSGNSLTGSPENPTVAFRNVRSNDKWLDGNDYSENVFAGVTASN